MNDTIIIGHRTNVYSVMPSNIRYLCIIRIVQNVQWMKNNNKTDAL